jgi:hypothetical protein
MARPPEIVTDFLWRRSPRAILSAQLQDKVCGGQVVGNAENSSSVRRERAVGLWQAIFEEGVESLGAAGKRGDTLLAKSPFSLGTPSHAYRKLSPIFVPRKSAFIGARFCASSEEAAWSTDPVDRLHALMSKMANHAFAACPL